MTASGFLVSALNSETLVFYDERQPLWEYDWEHSRWRKFHIWKVSLLSIQWFLLIGLARLLYRNFDKIFLTKGRLFVRGGIKNSPLFLWSLVCKNFTLIFLSIIQSLLSWSFRKIEFGVLPVNKKWLNQWKLAIVMASHFILTVTSKGQMVEWPYSEKKI